MSTAHGNAMCKKWKHRHSDWESFHKYSGGLLVAKKNGNMWEEATLVWYADVCSSDGNAPHYFISTEWCPPQVWRHPPTQGLWVQLLMDDENSKLPNVASSPQQMMHKGPWRRQHIKKSAKPVCDYDITKFSLQGKTCRDCCLQTPCFTKLWLVGGQHTSNLTAQLHHRHPRYNMLGMVSKGWKNLHGMANGFNSTFSTEKIIHSYLLVLILLVCRNCQDTTNFVFCLAVLARAASADIQFGMNLICISIFQWNLLKCFWGQNYLFMHLHVSFLHMPKLNVASNAGTVIWIQSSKKRRISASRWGGSSLICL